MMKDESLRGTRVKLFTTKALKFQGPLLSITGSFVRLRDDKTGQIFIFPASSIEEIIEVTG